VSLCGGRGRGDFQFLDDVVCHLHQESKRKVELLVVVEIQVDSFVEKGVCQIELERLVETEMDPEYSPSVSFQLDWHFALLVNLLYPQSRPFADVLPILKAEMRKINVFRGMVFQLKETLSFEKSKLLLVVLTSEVDGYHPVPILYSFTRKLPHVSLGQCRKVMFDEDFMIDSVVFLEGDVSHGDLRLHERKFHFIVVVFGVVVSDDQLERGLGL